MKKIIPLILISIFISGCNNGNTISDLLAQQGILYRADVNQGSVFNQEQVSRLEIGMTPQQVNNIMGSSSIQDPFHSYRWDYINASSKKARMTVYKVRVDFDRETHLVSNITASNNIPKD